MPVQFDDIKMAGFIDDTPRHLPAMPPAVRDVRIRFSANPPQEWVERFNREWRENNYSERVRAEVSAGALHIHCMPRRFADDHQRQLERVIAVVNDAYRRILEERYRAQAADKAKEAAKKSVDDEEFERLKRDVKF